METYYKNNLKLQVLTDSGFQDFEGLIIRDKRELIKITLENGKFIECTPNHLLKTENGWEEAITLTDEKVFSNGEFVRIIDKTFNTELEEVYDLVNVTNGNSYYTNDILSHNCVFVSDEETLIDSMFLKEIKTKQPIFDFGSSRWWKEPEANNVYICALDPSSGTGKDYSVIQIFSLNPFEQVAEWRSNTTDIKGQCKILVSMMGYIWDYLVENPNQQGDPEIYWTFENNSLGLAIKEIIKDNGEEAFPGQLLNVVKTGNVNMGYNTNKTNKLKNCIKLKSLIETNRLKINSSYLLSELKNFIASGGSYAAKSGYHDDAVSAVLLVLGILEKAMNWSNQEMDVLKENLSDETDDEYEDDIPAVLF